MTNNESRILNIYWNLRTTIHNSQFSILDSKVMNITELARRLKVPTPQLREELQRLGFDIGFRAIKIDDRVAAKVIKLWTAKKEQKVNSSYVVVEKKIGAAPVVTKTKTASLPAILTTRELADILKLPVTTVIGELFKNGVMASINERIDFETASIIAQDLGFTTLAQETSKDLAAAEAGQAKDLGELLQGDSVADLKPRPPVVVVMGHVDHGKTKLLDAIRETNVAEGERGAITQHIGAYQAIAKDRLITFLDTPGHEAFAAMRSRGGRLADVAIIVIAADDGVQPQTIEALEIAQREKLPFLIAINKVDKADADIEKLKKQLAELNLLPEDWGGKTICVPISAKQRTGLDTLLEMVLLLADLEKFTANPNRLAVGTIIEAHIDKGEGPVATALVQAGTLRRGDSIIAGRAGGKVRAMKNFSGKDIIEAKPSTPVKILGLKLEPVVGDIFKVVSEKEARQSLKKTPNYHRQSALPTVVVSKTDDDDKKKDDIPGVHLILKTDVLGSREAILSSMEKLSTPDARVEVVKVGLGNITETDIAQAEGLNALVMGFQVSATPPAKSLANEKNIFVGTYTVIYDLLDEVKKQLNVLLKPELIRTQIGQGKVLAIFRRGKKDTIIGVKINVGSVKPGTKCKIIAAAAGGEYLVEEVRLGKEQVNEVAQGGECGLKLKGQAAVDIGQPIEIYHEEIRQRRVS